MSKKVVCYFILFLFFFNLIFAFNVFAQSPLDSTGFEDAANNIIDNAKDIQGYTEADKWAYLAEQWKEQFLKNEKIANLNQGLKNINPLLFFLFGEDYNFSLIFLFAVMLWVIFLFSLAEIINLYGTFSEAIGWAIASILAILFGHLGIYSLISLLIFKIIFFREGAWQWAGFIIFILIYGFLILNVRKFFKKLKENIEKRKEREAKMKEELDRELLHDTVEGIAGAFRKKK